MLNAVTYRLFKSIIKQPLKVLLVLLAVAFCVYSVMNTESVMEMAKLFFDVDYNPAAITGGFTLLQILICDMVFVSGFKGGALQFSTADVTFQLAGPFSSKFNLFMSALSGMKSCVLLLFILCSMSGVFSATLGTTTGQMLLIIGLTMVNMFITHFLSGVFCAWVGDREKLRKIINWVLLGLNLIVILSIIISLDSYSAKTVMAEGGSLLISRLFPIGGWIGILFEGILASSAAETLIGAALTVLSLIIVMSVLFMGNFDYYEISIQTALRIADMKEALRAGIDGDNIIVNSMVSLGNKRFKKGWGSSVLIYRHFIENSRLSHFSFINTQAFLYRIFGAVYLAVLGKFFTQWMGDVGIFVGGTLMMMVLNSIVFCGGKTVLEFNRPYIYLIPDKPFKKLFFCVLSDLPEMVFDSFICMALLAFFARGSVTISILVTFYITMLVFDLMCELVALICIRIFRNLGRFALMIVRYLIVYTLILVVMIPSMIYVLMNGVSIEIMYITMSAEYAAVFALLLLFSRNMIDKTEMYF